MRYIVGIDEVGRGALAGPVTVVAAAMPAGLRFGNGRLGKLRDSKKLSPKRREAWADYFLVHPQMRFAVARVYPRAIERLNISGAANLAALRAYTRLASSTWCAGKKHAVFLDGGLFLGSKKAQPKHAATVVKGDERIRVIAIASIIAKVSRDRAMARLAKKYPRYGFDVHKGYGTGRHMAAVKKYGPSRVHRLTFLN